MQGIFRFIGDLIDRFDGLLENIFKFDARVLDFYNNIISPLPELFKLLGAIFLAVIIVIGTLTFMKKLVKLFVVIAVIIVIVLAVT
jgi:hypothetical protein